MFLVSAIYLNHEGSRFDATYYLEIHRPMVVGLLAPHGFKSLRLVRGVAALDGSMAPYRMIAEMHFESREGFEQGMQEHGEVIMGDAANYTDIEPVLQVGELLVT